MKNYDLNKVRFDFKGAYIETKNELHIYLQRQGVSQTLNCAHPMFFVEISKNNINDGWSAVVSYSNDPGYWKGGKHGQVYKGDYKFSHKEAALEFAVRYASKLVNKSITVDDQVMGYCYGWYPYDYMKNDKFLSSVYFDSKTKSIKDTHSNKTMVAFKDGDIEKPHKIDKRVSEVVKRVLNGGFHDCDYKKGSDYCMRRAAWLLGQYFNEDYINLYPEFVSLQMER